MDQIVTSEQRRELLQRAIEARKIAYAPYSNYRVGAALLTRSGRVFSGANVENAAYPDSLCAERVAIVKAVSEGEREFTALAVVTSNGGTPCGSCRQVMAEFGLDMLVLIADVDGNLKQETTVSDLLPGAFGPGDLGK
jgi:cytidine deaminase